MPLLFIEQVFFAANAIKIFEGAWFPMVMAAAVAAVMVSWVQRRASAFQGDAAQRNRP